MERNFETVMIEQCSPVLAGLKPAGLFRHESRDKAAFYATVAAWAATLAPKGVRLQVLKECPHGHWYLVYLYRPARLGAALAQPGVRGFLQGEGYALPPADAGTDESCAALLAQLARRLACGSGFPHEIGLFLGYPLEDVVGFIENQGRNFTCCGCWKSYGDPAAARRHFAQLDKCRAIYLRLFHSGTPVLKLTVAA